VIPRFPDPSAVRKEPIMRALRFAGFWTAVLAAGSVWPAMMSAPSRHSVSLNGKWQVIVDPFENGYYNYQMEENPDGYFRNARPSNPSDLVEYAFTPQQTLSVPGDWNTQSERLYYYEGTVWYKKDFDWTGPPRSRVFLRFEAVAARAVVYLNGEKLGCHEGGFTPFEFEVTDRIREKGNFVVVKADNRRLREGVPTVNTDWWNYGGLTRGVRLIEVPGTFVADYFVQPDPRAAGRISGWIRMDGPSRSGPVRIEIPGTGLKRTLIPDSAGRAEFSLAAKWIPWSPENPRLYTVRIVSEEDRVEDRIGFRTVSVRGADLLLNGKPVFLRGVCLHEEAPFRTGRAWSEEDAATLLGWARELGCNFVRLAHYPHGEAMTRKADELGLMVWSEIPVYWTIQWENPGTLENATRQLEEMIGRDRNRASVILWSVANETPVGPARNAFLRSLIGRARSLDPTRLLTAAMDRNRLDDSTMAIRDPIGADLDVLGINEYIGWYDGTPEKCGRMRWETAYDKPHVISEFGGGALAGFHGDRGTRFTEEYQEDLYRRQIGMLRRIPFLRGACPWILMDFRSPRRMLAGVQDGFNRKGLISERGERKKAFYVMKEFYGEKAGER
jgi:beta-glucuronidase